MGVLRWDHVQGEGRVHPHPLLFWYPGADGLQGLPAGGKGGWKPGRGSEAAQWGRYPRQFPATRGKNAVCAGHQQVWPVHHETLPTAPRATGKAGKRRKRRRRKSTRKRRRKTRHIGAGWPRRCSLLLLGRCASALGWPGGRGRAASHGWGVPGLPRSGHRRHHSDSDDDSSSCSKRRRRHHSD